VGVVVLVIHGWWSSAGLSLWAEDATAPLEPPRRPGRRPRVLDHPYALAADELAKVLDVDIDLEAEVRATLTLPSAGKGPAASPEAQAAHAALGRDGSLAQSGDQSGLWRVPVIRLDPDAALALLLAAEQGESGSPPFLEESGLASFGGDLKFLSRLASFATDLAGRGRVLPAIVPGEDGAS
jgi:non-specific serine/threonine protein kinase